MHNKSSTLVVYMSETFRNDRAYATVTCMNSYDISGNEKSY